MRVTGYVDGYRDITSVRWDLLTEAMVLYGIVGADGSVTVRPDNSFRECVRLSHGNGCMALLTLGATSRAAWNAGVATPTLRNRIVNDAIGIMDSFGFDGIDLDLETPYADSYANWKALVIQLSGVLFPRGKLLSAATTAGVEAYGTSSTGTFLYRPSPDGAVLTDESLSLLDFLNVMAYDGHYVYTKNPALNAPFEFFTASLDYWLRRGISPSRLAIGIPFYGAKAADGINRNYTVLLADGADPNKDSYQGWRYNGLPTVMAKTIYAAVEGAGVMLFHMAGDDPARSLAMAVTHAIAAVPPTPDVAAALVHNKATLDWMVRTKATGGLGYSVAKTKLTHAYLEMVALGGTWPA